MNSIFPRRVLIFGSMPRIIKSLVLALIATLAITSSGSATSAKTALRADRQFSLQRVGANSSYLRETLQQNTLGYGRFESDSPLASRGAGQAVIGSLDDIGRMSLGNNGLSSMRQLIVNDKLWKSLSQAERWALNQKWLDTVIKAGDEVILATPKFAPDSMTAREVNYLLSKGYRWAAGGTKLVPK